MENATQPNATQPNATQFTESIIDFSQRQLTQEELATKRFHIENYIYHQFAISNKTVGFYFNLMQSINNGKVLQMQMLNIDHCFTFERMFRFKLVCDKFILKDKNIGWTELNDFLQIILSINNPRPRELNYLIYINNPKEHEYLKELKYLLEIGDPLAKNFAPETVKFLKTFDQPQKQKEYLFTFERTEVIREVSKRLNENTWKILSGLNFYDDNSPVKLSPDPYLVQKMFKFSFRVSPQSFLNFYEKHKNEGDLHRTDKVFLIGLYEHSDELTYDMFKKCLWAISNTRHRIPNTFFSTNFLLMLRNLRCIYNLWLIITYGLESEIENKTPMSPKYWYSFLTQEPYDPRLFLFIEEFLRC